MIFDIENWLQKSNFGTFWQLAINPKLKTQNTIFSFGYVDFWAKICPILCPPFENSTTRSAIMLILPMQNSIPKLIKLAIKKLCYLSRTHDLADSIYLNTRICVASKQRIVFCRIINTRSRKAKAKKGHKGHQSCDDVHDQNCARSMRPRK